MGMNYVSDEIPGVVMNSGNSESPVQTLFQDLATLNERLSKLTDRLEGQLQGFLTPAASENTSPNTEVEQNLTAFEYESRSLLSGYSRRLADLAYILDRIRV
jgi:hypothetical protein